MSREFSLALTCLADWVEEEKVSHSGTVLRNIQSRNSLKCTRNNLFVITKRIIKFKKHNFTLKMWPSVSKQITNNKTMLHGLESRKSKSQSGTFKEMTFPNERIFLMDRGHTAKRASSGVVNAALQN